MTLAATAPRDGAETSARPPDRAVRAVLMTRNAASRSHHRASRTRWRRSRTPTGCTQAGDARRTAPHSSFLHPLEVCCLLYHAGAPDHVIAAGVLHDMIEKTDANAADLRTRFGLPIATVVVAVSEDQRIIRYPERKAALCEQVASAGREALMVLAADTLSKVRELRLEHPQTPPRPVRVSLSRERRLAHYRQCLQLLQGHLTDSPLVTQLRTQLEKPFSTANGPPPLPGPVCL